jgi:hypothetical protein
MKYSLEEVKKIPVKTLLGIIEQAKKSLKKNDVFLDMCKEYDVSSDIIDIIPMRFGDIPVSARTERGIITFNYKLLCDGDFVKDRHYVIHECEHFLQQCYGNKPTQGADDGDYLSNPFEQDGFQRQIEYLDHMYGKDEAENYVDHLLDHHNIDDKNEREEKKEILMDKVE